MDTSDFGVFEWIVAVVVSVVVAAVLFWRDREFREMWRATRRRDYPPDER